MKTVDSSIVQDAVTQTGVRGNTTLYCVYLLITRIYKLDLLLELGLRFLDLRMCPEQSGEKWPLSTL